MQNPADWHRMCQKLQIIKHLEKMHCFPRDYNSLQYIMWFRKILMSQGRRVKRNAFPFTIYLYCTFLFMPNNIQKYLFTYLLGEGLWFRFSAHFFCILFILLSSKGFQCRWGPLKSWRKNAHKFDMLLCFWSCKNVLFYTFNISSSRKTFVCTCLILQVFVVSWFPET